MTTILAYGNSEGTRRCDARCHDATSSECDCICGGRYHGRGLTYAYEQLAADMAAGRVQIAGEQLVVITPRAQARQGALW